MSLEALDNDNNQLATGASKVGSGRRESIDNHTITKAVDYEQREHAADDDGSDREGEGGKGDGDGNEGSRQQRG